MIESVSTKIFAIGISATGTTSLHEALKILGYRTISTYGLKVPLPEPFDAATHETAAVEFRKLDRIYPDSKFICTTRNLENWLKSIRRHLKFDRLANPRTSWHDYYYTHLFGKADPNDIDLLHAYDNHLSGVRAYFAGREILFIDICGGAGWDELCPFLGVPVPNRPFPRANVGMGPMRYYKKKLRRPLRPLRKMLTRLIRSNY